MVRKLAILFLICVSAAHAQDAATLFAAKKCITYPDCQQTYKINWEAGDVPLTREQIQLYMSQASKEHQWHIALVSFDQFINTTFFWGHVDETISSHVRRVADDPQAKHALLDKFLNAILNVIQKDHGAKAQAGDLERAIKIVQTERKALGLPAIDLLK